jgi:DNA methylase
MGFEILRGLRSFSTTNPRGVKFYARLADDKEREVLREFFVLWGRTLITRASARRSRVLRRSLKGGPFGDVIPSERTPKRERQIADHPSLKPQSLLRRLVYAALPLGEGIIADPFMGSGSTVAAAEAMGLRSLPRGWNKRVHLLLAT